MSSAQAAAEDPDVYEVKLFVYDLTRGMATQLGPMLGIEVEGVWHTSIVVGPRGKEKEYFFGQGVQIAEPGTTPVGQPLKTMCLGVTQLPPEIIRDIAHDLGQSRFRPVDYNLFHNNCNHFSNEFSKLLGCAERVPEYILKQHEILHRSPMYPQLAPMLAAMEAQFGSYAGQNA